VRICRGKLGADSAEKVDGCPIVETQMSTMCAIREVVSSQVAEGDTTWFLIAWWVQGNSHQTLWRRGWTSETSSSPCLMIDFHFPGCWTKEVICSQSPVLSLPFSQFFSCLSETQPLGLSWTPLPPPLQGQPQHLLTEFSF
jgi:hypothetical protein